MGAKWPPAVSRSARDGVFTPNVRGISHGVRNDIVSSGQKPPTIPL
ncbi:MAG: hypothetical protein KDJ52_36265 [Anaerolineae bacterium]|nr:hypothetical protein [Anaerolineae bacterium]